jgi:hypothetical protein
MKNIFTILLLATHTFMFASENKVLHFDFSAPIENTKITNGLITPKGVIASSVGSEIIISDIAIPFLNPDPFTSMSILADVANRQGVRVFLSKADTNSWIELTYNDEQTRGNEHTWRSVLFEIEKDIKAFSIKIVLSANEKLATLAINCFNAQIGSTQMMQYNPNTNSAKQITSCPCPQPSYVPRTSWGSSLGLNGSIYSGTASITTVTHVVVHHSAGSNGSSNGAALVAAIFNDHVN